MTVGIDDALDALGAVPPTAWLAVAAAMLLQRLARHLGMWPYALIALPGTFAHELAHFLVALVLRADPQWPRLWPQRTSTGWRLGAVAFRAPWWRAGPIALAPLLLAPGALAWTIAFVAGAHGALLAVHAWLAGTLASAALPSRTDLRIAAPSLGVLAIVAIALIAIRVAT